MIRVQYVFGGAPFPARSRALIEIDESAPVDDLQEALQQKHSFLARYPAIILWRLKEPCTLQDIYSEVDLRTPSRLAEMMHLYRPLSDYGPWEATKIHIVITPESLESSPQLPINSIITLRERFVTSILPKEPPSVAAVPRRFSELQERRHYPFLCNRPSGAFSPLPTTLLHPIFGRFLDLCDSHRPTVQDNKLAVDISVRMSNIFLDEATRAAAFCSILHEFGIQVEDGSVGASGRRRTDGHYRFRKFPLIIVESNNEISSEGTEPFFQAVCHYGKFLQDQSRLWKQMSVLPCFHILLFGPFVAISSCMFTTKIQADILGPVIPLSAHPIDNSMQELTARTFGALRIALKELETYYEALPMPMLDPQATSFDPDCPYPNSYTDQESGMKHDFIYTDSQPHRDQRIFFAKVEGGKEICVKYVKQYSPEAHRLCAERKHAPQLLSYELLPGGWKMVVMEVLNIFEAKSEVIPPNSYHQFTYERDAIGKNSERLRKAIEILVKDLHDKKYVHGDLRDKNFFIKNDAKSGIDFMLLDFDWSGESGVVRYPMCVNQQVRRPMGAKDGEKILPEHDREMVGYMFSSGRKPDRSWCSMEDKIDL